LSRILDKSAFGGVALAMTITTFAELFVDQGFGGFITQTTELSDEHLDTAFWFNVGAGAVFSAAIAACGQPLANALDEPSAAPVIQWMSLSLLIRSFAVVPAAILVRELRFRSLSLRTVIAAAVGGTSGIIAAVSGLGVYSLVIQLLVGDLSATVILWGAAHWRPGRRFSKESLKSLAEFGTPIIGATILGFASRRLDNVIVGGALGLTLLGVYSMGQRVYQIALQIVNKSTTDVAFSALSRLGDPGERRHAFYRVIELTGVLCFPTYVGLALVAEPLTLTLFGPRWIDSAPVLVLFALSGVPFSLTTIHIAAIKSAAKTRFLFWINSILLVIYLPLILVLVHRGPSAAATASLISCCAILPVEIWFIKNALSLRVIDYLKALLGPAFATIVMVGGTLGVLHVVGAQRVYIQLLAGAVTGAITYGLALRFLAPATFKRCVGLVRQTFKR
jgi:PST family polysaccharide transporter